MFVDAPLRALRPPDAEEPDEPAPAPAPPAPPPPYAPAVVAAPFPPPVAAPSLSHGGAAPQKCCVCIDEDSDTAFLPCGHMVACANCAAIAHAVTPRCPTCRGVTTGVVRIYM